MPPLERGDPLLEHVRRRVHDPRVDVAGPSGRTGRRRAACRRMRTQRSGRSARRPRAWSVGTITAVYGDGFETPVRCGLIGHGCSVCCCGGRAIMSTCATALRTNGLLLMAGRRIKCLFRKRGALDESGSLEPGGCVFLRDARAVRRRARRRARGERRSGSARDQRRAEPGKLLQLLATIRGARRILEVGTLGGYSTIWLARALPPGGSLVTLELNPEMRRSRRRTSRVPGSRKS